jgi:hypothetical protein
MFNAISERLFSSPVDTKKNAGYPVLPYYGYRYVFVNLSDFFYDTRCVAAGLDTSHTGEGGDGTTEEGSAQRKKRRRKSKWATGTVIKIPFHQNSYLQCPGLTQDFLLQSRFRIGILLILS